VLAPSRQHVWVLAMQCPHAMQCMQLVSNQMNALGSGAYIRKCALAPAVTLLIACTACVDWLYRLSVEALLNKDARAMLLCVAVGC
jgi:hypothetical protein